MNTKSKSFHSYDPRQRGDYFKQRRKILSERKGLIPGICGRQQYLTEDEKHTLIRAIVFWKDSLSQPTLKDIPQLVFFFVC
jgi:hypothetical protein